MIRVRLCAGGQEHTALITCVFEIIQTIIHFKKKLDVKMFWMFLNSCELVHLFITRHMSKCLKVDDWINFLSIFFSTVHRTFNFLLSNREL